MKKTIRNHIDTNTTTRRLAEGLILERRVTENGIDLRVMLQRPLEEYDVCRPPPRLPTSSSTWWKSTGAWRMLPPFSSWPLEKLAKICYADTETRRRRLSHPAGGAAMLYKRGGIPLCAFCLPRISPSCAAPSPRP